MLYSCLLGVCRLTCRCIWQSMMGGRSRKAPQVARRGRRARERAIAEPGGNEADAGTDSLCAQSYGRAARRPRSVPGDGRRNRRRGGRDPQRPEGRGDRRRHRRRLRASGGAKTRPAHHLDQRAAALQRLDVGARRRSPGAGRLRTRVRRRGAGALPGERLEFPARASGHASTACAALCRSLARSSPNAASWASSSRSASRNCRCA